MIYAINEIGKYLLESERVKKEDIIEKLVNKIQGDSIKEILLINVTKDGIKTEVEQFYKDIVNKALFFQVGRGTKGGGIRADYYKLEEKKKLLDKISSAVKYCEVTDYYNEIESIILDRINNVGKEFFAVILRDGNYPVELFSEKFLNDFYRVDFKQLEGNHTCHLCGDFGHGFNSVAYKLYTNDKEVYGNVNDEQKSGVVICKQCLEHIILAKKYVEDYLTTYWMGSNVMFIPHSYNEELDYIYRNTMLNGKEEKRFLDNISGCEEEVLEALGNGNSETDIIFFKKDVEKTFYIFHTIKSLLPSRFAFLSKAIRKNKVSLYWLVNKVGAVKGCGEGLEATEKERFKLIDEIFSGKKISRNIFFQRMMKQFKENYYSKEGKTTNIYEINKYYNFLVDCKCLEGGFDYMREYKDYSELFQVNEKYFSSNEKKAWFIVGVAYNKLNRAIKNNNKDDEGKPAERSSMDKNFFFSRKFDFKDFIVFTNLIDEKMRKYPKLKTSYIKKMLAESKDLMADKENKVSTDEAKYIFFWGMDIYFKKDEVKDNEEGVL